MKTAVTTAMVAAALASGIVAAVAGDEEPREPGAQEAEHAARTIAGETAATARANLPPAWERDWATGGRLGTRLESRISLAAADLAVARGGGRIERRSAP